MNKTKITQARNWWAGNYVLQRLLLAIICFIISIKKKKKLEYLDFLPSGACWAVLNNLTGSCSSAAGKARWDAEAHNPTAPQTGFLFPDMNRRIIKVGKKPLKIICPTKHQCCPLTKSLTTTSTRLLNTGCLRGNKWCSEKSLCSILACQVA